MKKVLIHCDCGSKLCHSSLTLKDDDEKKHNIILSLKDKELGEEHWISLSKEMFAEMVRAGRTKFGRVE